MSLLNDDFLLTTPMAKKLFHDHAEKKCRSSISIVTWIQRKFTKIRIIKISPESGLTKATLVTTTSGA